MSPAAQERIERYHLQAHPEGGWFSEEYTAPDTDAQGRPWAGNIYFLLEGEEISHLHEIDCDELWLYHEGCGLCITVLEGDGDAHLLRLGVGEGQQPTVLLRRGSVFAAECEDAGGFCLISCVTVPRFSYEGFHLVTPEELQARFPVAAPGCMHLAYTEGKP